MVRGGMADVLDLAALYEWGQWVKSSMALMVLKRKIPRCGKSCLKTLLVRIKGICSIYTSLSPNPQISFIAPRTAFVKSCVVFVPPISGVLILL